MLRMESTRNSAASLNAKTAVTALRNFILNPPTSIATAILPRQMSDRLRLATIVFSVECFIEALKHERPELAVISAALPAAYMQAECMINAADPVSNACGESSSVPASMMPRHCIECVLSRSKIDLNRGIAELPPAGTSSTEFAYSDKPGTLTTDGVVPGVGLAFILATRVWDSICSFRGLL